MKFTHLHVHSHYSLLDGLPKIDAILKYVKKGNMDSVALTDHGVMYGAIEFYKKAKVAGIKPIIGEEFYIAFEKMTDRRPHLDDKRYHLVLLAKNLEGYKNLIKLTTRAHLEGFYYKPRIDNELLSKYCSGLIALSGCLQGRIPRLILAKNFEEAERLAKFYQELFGKDEFYLEIQFHPNLPEQKKVNEGLLELSEKLNIPIVATNDCHYLNYEDAEAQDVLMAINTDTQKDDPERLTMKNDDFSMHPPEKMLEFFRDSPEAIENTQKIKEMCNLEIPLGEIHLPFFKVPQGYDINTYLEKLCAEGLKKRNMEQTEEITERLNYELSVIKQTGFASYFLIVQDFVNWAKAKENNIVVGPGRGSAAGSLVSYLLNITNINPLKYGLLFERFLNPERAGGLPDIDLDFADTRRDEVVNYVSQKYGQDKVSRIITFGTMAARQVIRDVGRALNYTYSYCDQIAKTIPMFYSLNEALEKVDEFKQAYQTDENAQRLIDLSKKLEGVARHASTHACGVVITKNPLEEYLPLQRASRDDQTIITQYEMHSIEDLGLLKMDFLGLRNLTIIENALNLINKTNNINLSIDNFPLNDQKTLKIFQKAQTTGLFQYESSGMKRYLRELKPTEFNDLITMVALYRPGPMELIPDFIARKYGKKKIEYLHPKLEPILKETYGIAVFQEQILKIAREIAGFTLGEADILRKAIGKKIKALLDEQHEKFIQGAIKNGVHKATAERIFQFIEPFAGYAFNLSHASCYALIGYQTGFLKAHWPVEFMAALMSAEGKDIERIAVLVDECKRMEIEVLPPDINESDESFTPVGKNSIRFGLASIKNVGHNVVRAIIKEREENRLFGSITDILKRVDSHDLNKKSLESLIKAGALDKLEERTKLLANLDKILNYSKEIKNNRQNRQRSLFQGSSIEPLFTLKIEESSFKITKEEKLTWERELLGLYVSDHPLRDYEKVLEKIVLKIREIDESFSGKRIRIAGVITKIQKIITKSGKPMLFAELEDLTDRIETLIFPRILEENPTLFQINKIVFCEGAVSDKDGVPKLLCERIEELINHET